MEIFQIYYDARNEENAVKMAAYMKNNFPFLGIQKPKRASLAKEFLKERKQDVQIDWKFIRECYSLPEREFHYLAIEYLGQLKKYLKPDDMDQIEQLIITHSWWDSVDGISPIVGYVCKSYPELKETVITKWMMSENYWLNRVSILFQLKYKTETDTDFLQKAILANCHTKEFFINKAVGWALREYSKTNSEWVQNFIKTHKLSPLSIREGSKYLTK